jgi:hypothetical protein
MELEVLRKKALVAIKDKFRGYLNEDRDFMLCDAVEYMYLHDKFAKVGVFISRGDKEENYIKILEQEDESLLECLDRYLELVETADLLKDINQTYNRIQKEIKEAQTEEEILKLVKGYVTEDYDLIYGPEPKGEKE